MMRFTFGNQQGAEHAGTETPLPHRDKRKAEMRCER
jgi:hypothetical protein